MFPSKNNVIKCYIYIRLLFYSVENNDKKYPIQHLRISLIAGNWYIRLGRTREKTEQQGLEIKTHSSVNI